MIVKTSETIRFLEVWVSFPFEGVFMNWLIIIQLLILWVLVIYNMSVFGFADGNY